jgi:hypothetical protein
MSLTGFTEMHVHIDEPRGDDESGRVEDYRIRGLEAAPNGDDPVPIQEDIEPGIGPGRGVDHPTVSNQSFHLRRFRHRPAGGQPLLRRAVGSVIKTPSRSSTSLRST